MISEIDFLVSGIILGFTAGIAPGPLMTLVLSETLKHGIASGIKVALVPLLSDFPIVCVSIWILAKMSDIHTVLGCISVVGGFFLVYLGYESLIFRGDKSDFQESRNKSVQKGIITNFLNPHPYVFWLSIGAPLVLKAYHINLLSSLLFIISFYVMLVGAKIGVALLTGKYRHFLKDKSYIYTIRLLGIALFIFAFIFFREGLEHFGSG